MRSLFLRLLVSLWAAMTLIVGIWALIHAWAVSSDSGPLHAHFNVRAVELRAELALLCELQGLDECDKSLAPRERRDDRIALYRGSDLLMGESIDGAAPLVDAARSSPEGVDERLLQECVDAELSIGDYVLSGGELAAMVMLDAVVRRCEIPTERHFHNIVDHGNQAAAGAPTVTSMRWNDFKPGDIAALVVVGSGLSWASLAIEFS